MPRKRIHANNTARAAARNARLVRLSLALNPETALMLDQLSSIYGTKRTPLLEELIHERYASEMTKQALPT